MWELKYGCRCGGSRYRDLDSIVTLYIYMFSLYKSHFYILSFILILNIPRFIKYLLNYFHYNVTILLTNSTTFKNYFYVDFIHLFTMVDWFYICENNTPSTLYKRYALTDLWSWWQRVRLRCYVSCRLLKETR